MLKQKVHIKNWLIRYSNWRKGMELVGDAINHPILGSTKVYTSRIININLETFEVETLNTIYILEQKE